MLMPENIKSWRKERRAEMLARRQAIPEPQYREWTSAITQLLVTGFPLLGRMTVGFYWPFKGEFDPRFAIHKFRQDGATAALPVVVEKKAPLQFREWWPGVQVTPGVFELPVPDAPLVVPGALLIPPVGFDVQGYRLGYGGGYFDRTLATLTPSPLRVGVAFELSKMATIHPQAHDVPMDFMVTETGIHHVGTNGLERLEPGEAAERAEATTVARQRGGFSRDDSKAEEGSRVEGRDAPRQYASPPCYAHEFDYWQEGSPDRKDNAS